MAVKKHLVQKIGDTDKEAMVSEPFSKEEEMVAEIIRLLKKYGEEGIREISDSMGQKHHPPPLERSSAY